MDKFTETIKVIIGSAVTAVSGALGGFDGIMYALLACVTLDYITGVALAIKNRKLSSEVGFVGLFKKILIFALVGVANMIDCKIIGGGAAFRTAVTLYYIGNEGVSLLENAASFGLKLPKKLVDVMVQLRDSNSGEDKS